MRDTEISPNLGALIKDTYDPMAMRNFARKLELYLANQQRSGTGTIDTAYITTLTVSGGFSVSGTTTFGGVTKFPDGSAAAPSITYTNDTDTGFYRIGSDNLGITTNGTLRFDVSSTALTSTLPFHAPDGSASAPSLSFSGDTNTGIFSDTADELGFTTAGTERVTIKSDGDVGIGTDTPSKRLHVNGGDIQIQDATPNLIFESEGAVNDVTIAANINDVTSGGVTVTENGNNLIHSRTNFTFFSTADTERLRVGVLDITATLPYHSPDGSASAPAYSFSDDTNTGIYRIGADNIGFTTAGTLRVDVDSTAITSTVPIHAPDGSASSPSLSFSGDTNTGMYRIGADNIGVATAGTLRVDVSSTAITSTIPLHAPDGSASAPSLSFSGDTNTGIFSDTADELGFTTAGTERMTIKSDGKIGIGTDTPTFMVDIVSESENDLFNLVNYESSAPGPGVQISKARGTEASPAVVQSNDTIGAIRYYGWNDTAWDPVATIQAKTQTVTGSGPAALSGLLRLRVANTSGVLTTRVEIDEDGLTTFDAGITVEGAATFNDNVNISGTNELTVGTGTPIVTLNKDGLTVNDGTDSSSFTSDQITMDQSGVGPEFAPAYSFSGDTNTGMYRFGADQIGWSTGGTRHMLLNASGNLGIGTDATAPATNLEVRDNSTAPDLGIKSTGDVDAFITFDTNRGSVADGVGMIRANWNGTEVAQVRLDAGADTTNKDDGRIRIRTAAAGTLADAVTIFEDQRTQMHGDLIVATKTPANASDTGTAGTIAWDSNYIYVCTATDTWKRVAISTW